MDGGDIPPKSNGGIEHRFEFSQLNQADGGMLLASQTGGQGRHEVNVSGIKSVDVPNSWTQTTDSYLGGRGLVSTFSPGGNSDMVLSVLDKGTRLNADQSKNLDSVLSLADSNGRPKVLLPSQIRSVTDALGKTTVGDNQYVNTAKPPDPAAPVFKIMAAQVITVDGRPVIEVEGQFLDENGQRLKDYIGIYGKGEDGKINQMFMQTSSKDEYLKGRKIYKDALQSLDWK